ncbi:chromatin structure-remodeling complex protein SYD-like [Triticum dicoccoides]|uniref:chromatin structure-remodeling complex protein SYD-like n=1 Tax=Triticum dicoccoides TaxID=85692 RepID=UPI000E79D931|nr:chromatin structure-remodeling complex protein SYD-like [Triticum dicoccoides]
MLPSTARPAGAAAYTQPQLRQMRAQCIVFLAFKNQMEPRKRHLEIALGEDDIDGAGCHGERTTTSSPSQASSSSAAPLPPPHLLSVSSLRLSPPVTEQEQENRERNDDPAAEHE